MDIQLHYLEQGQGFPLLLLHGNGESADYFRAQLDALSARWRVIAVDTRGHGASPRGCAPFTLAQFADDLRCFMDEHKIARAHMLGFSDGGNIALLFALRYPERVERLILNGANLYPSGVKPAVQLPIVLGYAATSLFAPFRAQARAKKELLGLMVTQPRLHPDALAALTRPTLVIAGTRDMIKGSHTRLIAASIPHAQLRIIPGDHFIAARSSAAFNAAVEQFLLSE